MSETRDLMDLRELIRKGDARAIRKGADLTARSVAADLGVSAATVNRWETGKIHPSRANALAWLKLLRRIQATQNGAGTDGR